MVFILVQIIIWVLDINNGIIICFGFPYIAGINTLPISYTLNPSVVASGEFSWNSQDNAIQSSSLTTFNARVGKYDYLRGWLSIGI